MSDDDLRALERAAATGDVQDGARWLTARRRVGSLTAWWLELAAYLGDPAANVALLVERPICKCPTAGLRHSARCPLTGKTTAETPTAFRVPWPLFNWLTNLPANSEVLVRAAVAVEPLAVASAEAAPRRAALRTGLEAWVACPCPKHADPLRSGARSSRRSTVGGSADELLAFAATVSFEPGAQRYRRPFALLAAQVARPPRSVEVVRSTIARALLPWVLR